MIFYMRRMLAFSGALFFFLLLFSSCTKSSTPKSGNGGDGANTIPPISASEIQPIFQANIINDSGDKTDVTVNYNDDPTVWDNNIILKPNLGNFQYLVPGPSDNQSTHNLVDITFAGKFSDGTKFTISSYVNGIFVNKSTHITGDGYVWGISLTGAAHPADITTNDTFYFICDISKTDADGGGTYRYQTPNFSVANAAS